MQRRDNIIFALAVELEMIHRKTSRGNGLGAQCFPGPGRKCFFRHNAQQIFFQAENINYRQRSGIIHQDFAFPSVKDTVNPQGFLSIRYNTHPLAAD